MSGSVKFTTAYWSLRAVANKKTSSQEEIPQAEDCLLQASLYKF